MEKKFVRVPFDVEMSKRISDGEVDGRIVTEDGESVRIICYDREGGSFPIVGLVKNKACEDVEEFTIKGELIESQTSGRYLYLYVPQNIADLSNVEGNGKKYELKPFDKVLCRDHDTDIWWADFYSHMTKGGRYHCIGLTWRYCIPYNDRTAHLLGTTDNYDEDEKAME